MKYRNRWVCGLLSACILYASVTGCGLPSSLPEGPQNTALEQETEQEETRAAGTHVYDTAAIPARYDYREHGRCPAAGSQGELGTCWAFATMLALESSLLPEEAWDFSEDHLSLHNSFGMTQDMGGDYTMAMAYLLAWQGPVLEAEDPYGDGYSPDGLLPARHIQEIQLLKEKDYDAIKRAVYFRGGVQTSLYTSAADGESSLEYYNKDTCAYYYRGSLASNHDVVIVGWDDEYPRENFAADPGRDGAFLCMNSWGTEFGDGGLFYVSYADSNIGTHSLVYTGVEAPDNYDRIYQSDFCGWMGQLGYGDGEAYFANVYTAEADEALRAVGFYATGEQTEYEVYLAEQDGDGELRLDRRLASGSLKNAGFYTVRLAEAPALPAGEPFAVAVHIRTPGEIHPVAVEYQGADGVASAQVELEDGEGYISADGIRWSRTEKEQQSNVCLKAYTGKR